MIAPILPGCMIKREYAFINEHDSVSEDVFTGLPFRSSLKLEKTFSVKYRGLFDKILISHKGVKSGLRDSSFALIYTGDFLNDEGKKRHIIVDLRRKGYMTVFYFPETPYNALNLEALCQLIHTNNKHHG